MLEFQDIIFDQRVAFDKIAGKRSKGDKIGNYHPQNPGNEMRETNRRTQWVD